MVGGKGMVEDEEEGVSSIPVRRFFLGRTAVWPSLFGGSSNSIGASCLNGSLGRCRGRGSGSTARETVSGRVTPCSSIEVCVFSWRFFSLKNKQNAQIQLLTYCKTEGLLVDFFFFSSSNHLIKIKLLTYSIIVIMHRFYESFQIVI